MASSGTESTREALRKLRKAAYYLAVTVALGAILLLLFTLALYKTGYKPLPSEESKPEAQAWADPENMELKGDTIRVLSLNLNFGAGNRPLLLEQGELVKLEPAEVKVRLDSLAQLAQEEKIDVLALQGVDFGSDYAGGLDQAEYLARRLQFGYVAKALMWQSPYLPFPAPLDGKVLGKVSVGLAVISRIPISKSTRFSLPSESLGDWWMNAFSAKYCLQQADLTSAGKQLQLFNVQLTRGNKLDRQAQASQVASFIHQYSLGKALLAGTVFSQPRKPEDVGKGEYDCTYDLLRHKGNFKPLFADIEAGKDPERFATYTEMDKTTRIHDYALPERNLEVRSWRILPESAVSPHRPIVIEVVP